MAKVDIHPVKLTWGGKTVVWGLVLPLACVIFRFHVNFPGFIQPSTIRFVFSVRYLGEWQ